MRDRYERKGLGRRNRREGKIKERTEIKEKRERWEIRLNESPWSKDVFKRR